MAIVELRPGEWTSLLIQTPRPFVFRLLLSSEIVFCLPFWSSAPFSNLLVATDQHGNHKKWGPAFLVKRIFNTCRDFDFSEIIPVMIIIVFKKLVSVAIIITVLQSSYFLHLLSLALESLL